MSRGAVALTNVNTGPTSPLAAAVIEVMYAARSVPASSSARPQTTGVIPEPATLVVVAFGLAGVILANRRA